MGKLPNSAPDGFQRLADAAVEGQHYRDTCPLWGYLCKGQTALANDIHTYCTTSGGQPYGKLIKRLEDAIKAMRQAKKRGTWKPSRDLVQPMAVTPGPSASQANAKPPPRTQQQPLASRTCVGSEEMLWTPTSDEDGKGQQPAARFDIEDTNEESCGYAISTAAAVARFLDLFLKADKFANPCALICNKSNLDSLMAKHNREVVQRYEPTELTLYFAANKGAPLPENCIMFNLGVDKITFDDRSAQAHVTGDLADSITVSIQIPNVSKAGDFDKDVKNNFMKTAVAALGAKLLYKENVPFHTGTHDKIWRNSTIQKHIGLAKVQAAKIDEVWKKSGHGGIEVRALGKEKFYFLPLPGTTTWAEARAKSTLLGALAYGTVTVKNGFAVRVHPERKVEAEKLLNPEYADLLGDDLMTLPKHDGVRLRISGVPRAMDDATLVQKLTMETLQGWWKCKPQGAEKSTTPGRKTIIAVALTPPPRVNMRIFLADGESAMVHIAAIDTPAKQLTQWDKIGMEELPRKAMNPRPTAASAWNQGAPSITKIRNACPAATKPACASWANALDEELDEIAAANEDVDMTKNCARTTDGGDPAQPVDGGTRKPTPKASAFMERMAEINRKNEETHKANAARQEKAEEALNDFKREMGEVVTSLQDTVATLSDSFATMSLSMANNQAQMQSAMAEQHNSLSQQIAQLAALIGAQQQLPQQSTDEEEEEAISAEDYRQFRKFIDDGARNDRERSPKGRNSKSSS
jgi:hypothetical protein